MGKEREVKPYVLTDKMVDDVCNHLLTVDPYIFDGDVGCGHNVVRGAISVFLLLRRVEEKEGI